MCKSKFKPAMLAALALLVAAPIAGADPARVVSDQAQQNVSAQRIWPDYNAETAPVSGADLSRVVSQNESAQRIWPDYNAETAPVASSESALPVRWPDAGAVYSTESVSQYGSPDPWAISALNGSSVTRPDAATIAGMRMNAAAQHYGVTTADYGVNTTDYSRPDFAKPSPAVVAGLRMNAAAEHYGASVTSGAPGAPGAVVQATATDLRAPDTNDAAAATRPQPPSVSDLRSPDTRDAGQPRQAPAARLGAPDSGNQPQISPADSDFPWAGLFLGLGLAGMASLLALVAVRGSRARPLGR